MTRPRINTARHAALVAAAFAGVAINAPGYAHDETADAVRGLHDAIAEPGLSLDREDINLLMQIDRGREELVAFAKNSDAVYYDGHARFAQVVSGPEAHANPSIDLTGPTLSGFTGRIAFDTEVEIAGVEFTTDQIVAEIVHAGVPRTLGFDWAGRGAPPSETVKLERGTP
jgi:hypothetical protein